MLIFWLCVFVLAVVVKRRHGKRQVRMLYRRGELVGEYAVFSCGCRFHYSRPQDPPTICQAHRAIIDAEVAA